MVSSGSDDAEQYRPGDIDPEPRLVVTTSGALGGWAQPGGPYTAAPLPPTTVDSYGAGDCFAAGLAFALAAGLEAMKALEFALAAEPGRSKAPAFTRSELPSRKRAPMWGAGVALWGKVE